MVKDIICLWTGEGSRFSEDYVHKLKSMVDHHTTHDHRFFCLSPQPIEGITTLPLTLPLLQPRGWNMVRLFDGYPQLSNNLLYFDLDTIILDNIDFLMELDSPLAVMHDMGGEGKSNKILWGGAIMSWQQDKFTWVGESFTESVMDVPKYRNRADLWYGYLIQEKGVHFDYLQDLFPDVLHSYKLDLAKGDPLPATKIVCFHGIPLPHEVANQWVMDNWV